MTTVPSCDRAEQLARRVLRDLGAAAHAATVLVGDKLGLYRTLADTGPATAPEVAASAGCDERYVIEWLDAQVASGYCEYDPPTHRYWLNPAQVACLADVGGSAFLAGGAWLVGAMFNDADRVGALFRGNLGMPWGDHHEDLFVGHERFFLPTYRAGLLRTWLPSLDGVTQRLDAGIAVADVGCGRGAVSILLAEAFPASTIVGFDPHPPSIQAARAAAAAAGVDDRVRFEVASAQDFPGTGYGLISVVDALHDMGDPVRAARRIRTALTEDGTWLLVEPRSDENPLSRLFRAVSTFVCTPGARAQQGGWALGAQASDTQLRTVCERAGFTRFRQSAETETHRVLEVRP